MHGAKGKTRLPLAMAQIGRNARARGDVVVHLHSRDLTFVLKSPFAIGLGRAFFVLLHAAMLFAGGSAWEIIVGPDTPESLLAGVRFGPTVAVLHGAAVMGPSTFRGSCAVRVTLGAMGRPMMLPFAGFVASESLLSIVCVEAVVVGEGSANVMGRPTTLNGESASVIAMGRPMTGSGVIISVQHCQVG